MAGCHLGKAPWVQAGSPPHCTGLEERAVRALSWAHLFIQLLNPPRSQVLLSHCASDMHKQRNDWSYFWPRAVYYHIYHIRGPALWNDCPRFIIKDSVESERSTT